MDSASIVETITKTINTLFSNLFSSIDTNVYAALDDLTFISKDIMEDGFTSKLFGSSTTSGIILIANAVLVGLAIFYAIRYFCSNFINGQVEKPYQFIFKFIVISAFMNCSYFVCEQFININFLISGAIRELGESTIGCNVCYEQLIVKINTVVSNDSTLNVFSFDGMIKSFTSMGLINLLFSYSLRYIMVKVFVLLTPFMIMTLLNNNTVWIFKSWIKSVLSLLLVQSLISVILVIIFSMDYSDNSVLTKLMYIGSIYALTKASSFIRQILGGISTEVSSNVTNITKMLK